MTKNSPNQTTSSYRDIGFDEFGIHKDVQNRSRASIEQNEKVWREDVKMKEELRLKKVTTSSHGKIEYAIQQLIEKAILSKGSFTTNAYDLGFEDKYQGWIEAEQLLTLLKDKGCLVEFHKIGNKHFKILHVNKGNLIKYQNSLSPRINGGHDKQTRTSIQSIHLITESITSDDKVFVVLDEHYEKPFRMRTRNAKGQPTYIKKLHNIAYVANAPGKKVLYTENIARNINNALFRRRDVAKYMATNKLTKPTLVGKSEDGEYLVLKNESLVKTILIQKVPSQYESLYVDKTLE